jgi:hypothetical protein
VYSWSKVIARTTQISIAADAAHYRLRFHRLDHSKEVRPQPNYPCLDCPVHAVQSLSSWYQPRRNVQLMTEQHILSLKPPARVEKDHHYDHGHA